MYKIIKINLSNCDRQHWEDLIDHNVESLLESAVCVNEDKLIICHLKNVKSCLSVHKLLTGEKISDIDISLGCVANVTGRKRDDEAFIHFTSFLTPGIIYSYNFSHSHPKLEHYLFLCTSIEFYKSEMASCVSCGFRHLLTGELKLLCLPLPSISPLHNVKIPSNPDVQYPALLILTADHDDRVVPLHSFKFIATLQEKLCRNCRQTNPILIRIEPKAGHGQGKPTSKSVSLQANK
ncbi:uncharacterized protein DC041_0012658 [Schistosoma bovis]|uniref:Prolyl endopeptidase n=1 Tax=Schistosoma bovis TaxID=6184 RepID=A0A430QQ15_SCHBO|nr:uncharacterized protein DC041_0012658 [Schistosoma bovis]